MNRLRGATIIRDLWLSGILCMRFTSLSIMLMFEALLELTRITPSSTMDPEGSLGSHPSPEPSRFCGRTSLSAVSFASFEDSSSATSWLNTFEAVVAATAALLAAVSPTPCLHARPSDAPLVRHLFRPGLLLSTPHRKHFLLVKHAVRFEQELFTFAPVPSSLSLLKSYRRRGKRDAA